MDTGLEPHAVATSSTQRRTTIRERCSPTIDPQLMRLITAHEQLDLSCASEREREANRHRARATVAGDAEHVTASPARDQRGGEAVRAERARQIEVRQAPERRTDAPGQAAAGRPLLLPRALLVAAHARAAGSHQGDHPLRLGIPARGIEALQPGRGLLVGDPVRDQRVDVIQRQERDGSLRRERSGEHGLPGRERGAIRALFVERDRGPQRLGGVLRWRIGRDGQAGAGAHPGEVAREPTRGDVASGAHGLAPSSTWSSPAIARSISARKARNSA